jgi:thiamine-monophosphate kinase
MERTVRDLGERKVIDGLARLLPSREDVAMGVGDDAAVVRAEGDTDLLLTTDPVVEGIHFLPGTPPELAGRKAVGRCLSDIAAMGGEPLWALIDLVAPSDTPMARVLGLYEGAAELARSAGLAIVGGDTSSGPALELHVFAVGRVPRGRALLRSGARPGERLYVTGRLGGSLAGRHLRFVPRLREGRWLRDGGWVGAMIDVSDGLATDVRHLLEQSGVGAVLDLNAVPVSPEARTASDGRSPVEHALFDGEDFELLFTVAEDRAAGFEAAWAAAFALECTAVGRTTDEPGVLRALDWQGRAAILEGDGYQHFLGEGSAS